MRSIQCKNCFNLINAWCEKVADSPHPALTRDCEHYQALTNIDSLRRMTDFQLASFLIRHGKIVCPYGVPYTACRHEEPFDKTGCDDCWVDWLNKEAKL